MVHLPDKYTDPHRERHKTIINDIKNERGDGFSAGNGTVVDGPLTICHITSKDEIYLTL